MPEGIREEKRRLRAAMRERLKALPEDYIESAGRSIGRKVPGLPLYREASSVFVYVSTPKEPDTRGIIRRALEDGKAVYVPKCTDGRMYAVRLRDPEALVPGAFGIPEPEDMGETIQAPDIGVILAPCLAACPDGRRLGHGGGYYDRFLEGAPERTVCLCFGRMLLEDIPAEDTDVRMAYVLSEDAPDPAGGWDAPGDVRERYGT